MKEEKTKKQGNKYIEKIKEMRSDKKGRAELELMAYGIFFLILILFIRISSFTSNHSNVNTPVISSSIIDKIDNNYSYNIDINIDDNIYNYKGKVLGNNESFTKKVDDIEEYYYVMNDKYYILDNNGNYILTNKEDIYNIIDYNYLDINNIKEYLTLGTKNNNVYTIKVSDIILNSNSTDTITITIEDNKLIIDYTNILKIDNNSTNKALVTITYENIGKITTLEE